jgi:hypothetical protein
MFCPMVQLGIGPFRHVFDKLYDETFLGAACCDGLRLHMRLNQ